MFLLRPGVYIPGSRRGDGKNEAPRHFCFSYTLLYEAAEGGEQMDVSSIVQIIGSLGFPIAACIAVFWYLMKESENHKAEVNKLSEALQNNTLALTKLCDELEKGERNG